MDREREAYEAVRGGAGVCRPPTGVLSVRGDDAHDFLERSVTNELGIDEGETSRSLFLTPEGRTRADLRVLRTGDGFLVLTRQDDDVRETWRGNVFIEDVEVEETGFGVVRIQGPESDAVLDELGDVAAHVLPNDTTGEGGYDVVVPSHAAALDRLDVVRYGDEVAEVLRTEAGIPSFENELRGRVPLEAGLHEFVSFDKCYTGQEVVARVEQRGGGASKHLVGFELDDAVTGELRDDGATVGEVTTAVESPRLGPIGMGFVEKGTEDGVDVAGTEARIRELPFDYS